MYPLGLRMADDSGIDLSALTADFTAQHGDVLSNTLGGNYKISIADGATVTLKNATINGENNGDCRWAGLTCLGDATIILADGTTNAVKGFFHTYPGIYIPSGKTLTIKGTGTLDASSSTSEYSSGAGIGGGAELSCGDITIESTVTRVIVAQDSSSETIGAGYDSSCGTVTIGGVEGAISTNPYTYEPLL